MSITRRTVIAGAAMMPFAARAQSWPSGPIRIVVPFPPGGSVDAIVRLVQPALQQKLGTTIVVENRAGGSGSIGSAAVAKSPPDGNTWLAVFDNHGANPSVLSNLPYDTEKDFEPVLLIGTAPYLLSTAKSKPYRTLAEYIGAAKKSPSTISYGSVGSGSIGHLAMTLLSQRAAAPLIHVPYRGGGPAMNDAVAGHVDLLVGSTALTMPQVTAGNLRPLAQTGKTRNPFLRDVPTVSESGYPGFEANAWWGIFAPAGTPRATVDRFSKDFADSIRQERVTKQLTETQQVTLTLGGPDVLRAFVKDQIRVWNKVVKDNNIKVE